jgi:hypothetical protein
LIWIIGRDTPKQLTFCGLSRDDGTLTGIKFRHCLFASL